MRAMRNILGGWLQPDRIGRPLRDGEDAPELPAKRSDRDNLLFAMPAHCDRRSLCPCAMMERAGQLMIGPDNRVARQ